MTAYNDHWLNHLWGINNRFIILKLRIFHLAVMCGYGYLNEISLFVPLHFVIQVLL